jgi:hypothetical protein
MMVASPLNRPIRVDEVCMTLSFDSPFALASLKRFCGAPAERCLEETRRSLLTGSSARFFPQNTVPLLVLLGVYLAAGEALPQGLLGRLFVNARITGGMSP